MKLRQGNNNLTILICCYNAGKLLEKCLDSLISQNISSTLYKILFVDDGSTNSSLEIAKAYSKKITNFTLLGNEKNKGLVERCNKAIKRIETPYFVRLDADDWLSNDAVRKILKELNSLEEKDFILFNRWDVWNNKIKKIQVSNDIYTWVAVGTVFNTEAVRSVGGYSNEYWEEYDLYAKLLETGSKYNFSPYCIYYYRRGHQSMTQNYEKNKKGFESLINKWGVGSLKKFGNLERILKYYRIKKELSNV